MDASRKNAAEQRTPKRINMEEKRMNRRKMQKLRTKILPAGAGTARNLRNYGGLSGAAGGRKAKFSLTRRGI